jgi:hypothetical protein
MDACGAVVGAIHYGYYHILTQGGTSLSVEETLEGDVRGISCFAVLLNCSFP